WNVVATDGVCLAGTPYQFYVNPNADSDQLHIFFNGGGACWFGEACDLESQPNIHSPFADMDQNNPAFGDGIFALDNEDNPFASYNHVFLPYCTGDVFVGGGETEYTYTNSDDEEVTVTTFHNGYENTMTVLEWVQANFDAPSNILVSGSSAGAIGSSFYAGIVAEAYTDVPVTLLADAAGGYNSPDLSDTFNAWDTASILPDWDVYAGETNDTLTFEDFYIASANHNENLTIAQYNAAEDETQFAFTVVIGDTIGDFSIPLRIFNHYVEIESAVDNFYSYTAGGSVHTILRSPIFYTYEVEGVRFVDWMETLVNDGTVDDISCVNEANGCSVAPE
ncbi:MAG: pectin acetylesterase-family hydrolase, partial [Chloroflexota bacterium]